MKKTFLLALFAAVAPALAAIPTGFDQFANLNNGTTSTSGNLVISTTQGSSMATITLATAEEGDEDAPEASDFYTVPGNTVYNAINSTTAPQTNTQAEVSFSFILNLTAIQTASLTENVSLVTFNFNPDTSGTYHTVGLALSTDKTLYTFYKSVSTVRQTETLFNADGSVASALSGATFTANGSTYLQLTITQEYAESWKDANDETGVKGTGVQVYTKADSIMSDGGLAVNSNSELQNITFNTDYITAVAVTPSCLSAADAKLAAALVPEPTTATLSLLALAGLAARRRRK